MTPLISRRGWLAGYLPTVLALLGWSRTSRAGACPAEKPTATTPALRVFPESLGPGVSQVTTMIFDAQGEIQRIETSTIMNHYARRTGTRVEKRAVPGNRGRGMD
jgi:hypothetical protein